jgi:NADH-quinone oxidoreductase subunit J
MAFALFLLLGSICTGAVLVLVLSRDRSRGALSLVLAFAALGGIYGLLGAPFVAAVQVLIYAGAIMVLFLFVIMMVDPGSSGRSIRLKRVFPLALLLTAALAFELWSSLRGAPVQAGIAVRAANTSGLGTLLMGRYLYAFEITSLLIVAALVGAIALVGRKEPR